MSDTAPVLTVVSTDQGSRPMPEFVKRGLINVQGGQQYLKAAYRVLWMRDEHPDWSIVTSVIYADYDKGFCVMQATVLDGNGRVMATAHSEEPRGKLPYLKKAETGAIARALGLCGYGTIFGDMDEDSDENSMADSPRAAPARATPIVKTTPVVAPPQPSAPVELTAKDYRDLFIVDACSLGITAEQMKPAELTKWAKAITQEIEQTDREAWSNSPMWFDAAAALRLFHTAHPSALRPDIEAYIKTRFNSTPLYELTAAEWKTLTDEGVPAEKPILQMTDKVSNPPMNNPSKSTIAAMSN